MPKPLILFPFGGNAREALSVIEDMNRRKKIWSVLGFIDDNPTTWGKKLGKYKVLGDRKVLKKYPRAKVLAVPGNPANYLKRSEIIASLNVKPSQWTSIIHPSAVVSSTAHIGDNTLIMAHVVVGVNTRIGSHCVVLPNTTINHDVVVEDYCCLGSNVAVAGGVVIENNAYIGSAVSIREGLSIGECSLVGMGSNVLEDVPAETTVVGNPAKELNKIKPAARF
jgi:sugar O-acyltransferase (sialic acid O-acetyltransferase NeuD family)